MKKGVLILLGMFMMVSTMEAKNGEENLNFRVDYSYNNAVNFFENGIEFFVFTNGDFDFESHINNRPIQIHRDFRGRIRRVNNVSMSYDFRGNVTRIGHISIRYYRNRLTNVGNLSVHYDHWGNPIFNGMVRDYYYNNGIRFSINFGDVFSFNNAYFNHRDFRRNYTQIREDRNFYYYRARPNAKIGKRSTIIKRRKPANTVRNSNKIRRNNNNTYRKNDANRKAPVNKNSTYSNRKTDSNTKINRNSNTTKRKVDIRRKTSSSNNRNTETKRKVNTTRKKVDTNSNRKKRS
ncbi:hypothetical protein BW723_10670 [Polaribacter reichenbachii]|uniref:Uncharacterized protein n=1 Tax=Polaribacter reichenbachii TaxID=996801 RepID=A0A1B8TQB4_9FLAO|nr:hypothetical protein [Polaribacter reichenbachii]APZ46719.1 hypothetical protein BW723_10670 [Polaribacter reichenbachii]AUC17362.1 hypothetical protein BTO17_01115 [Polaribacter reichenbachii]OBY61762.1 hypothetical protein LPB301_17085 [Polaribacter reichenbachii]